eukprot:SAG31_NODE_7256_length_1741_cov_1.127284_1_plen_246_part_00
MSSVMTIGTAQGSQPARATRARSPVQGRSRREVQEVVHLWRNACPAAGALPVASSRGDAQHQLFSRTADTAAAGVHLRARTFTAREHSRVHDLRGLLCARAGRPLRCGSSRWLAMHPSTKGQGRRMQSDTVWRYCRDLHACLCEAEETRHAILIIRHVQDCCDSAWVWYRQPSVRLSTRAATCLGFAPLDLPVGRHSSDGQERQPCFGGHSSAHCCSYSRAKRRRAGTLARLRGCRTVEKGTVAR